MFSPGISPLLSLRLQCDEIRPACGRCQRAALECSLADATSNIVFVHDKTKRGKQDCSYDDPSIEQSRTANLTGRGMLTSPKYLESMLPSPRSATPSLASTFADDERQRLRLMCHYTLRASSSLAEITIPEDQDLSLWSVWVTNLALDCDFLLHGVLSLSALHLALCGVSQKHNTILAIHHHDQGVELYRPHLSNVTDGNYYAMIAFSCIIAFYALGVQHLSQPDENNPITNMEQFLTLMRASSVIIKADYAAVLQSPWAATMTHVSTEPLRELSHDIKAMLATLRKRLSSVEMETQDKMIYTSTIDTLQDSLEFAYTYLFTQKTITMFVLSCPTQFWDMTSAREPPALAILANYAVVLHWHRRSIWIQRWGKEVIDTIHQAIPAEWADCIQWAKRESELV